MQQYISCSQSRSAQLCKYILMLDLIPRFPGSFKISAQISSSLTFFHFYPTWKQTKAHPECKLIIKTQDGVAYTSRGVFGCVSITFQCNAVPESMSAVCVDTSFHHTCEPCTHLNQRLKRVSKQQYLGTTWMFKGRCLAAGGGERVKWIRSCIRSWLMRVEEKLSKPKGCFN